MRRIFLPLPLILLLSCSETGTEPPVPTSIQLSAPATLVGGAGANLSARVYDQNDREMAGQAVHFSSLTSSTGTVEGSRVIALQPGSLRVRAASGSVSGEAQITVTAGPAPTLPSAVTLPRGETFPLPDTWGEVAQPTYTVRIVSESPWVEGVGVFQSLADRVATGIGTVTLGVRAYGSEEAVVAVTATSALPVIYSSEQRADTLMLRGYRPGGIGGLSAEGSALALLSVPDSTLAYFQVPAISQSSCQGSSAAGVPLTLSGGEFANAPLTVILPREDELWMEVGELRMLPRGSHCLRVPGGLEDARYIVTVLSMYGLDQAVEQGFDPWVPAGLGQNHVRLDAPSLSASLENRSGTGAGAPVRVSGREGLLGDSEPGHVEENSPVVAASLWQNPELYPFFPHATEAGDTITFMLTNPDVFLYEVVAATPVLPGVPPVRGLVRLSDLEVNPALRGRARELVENLVPEVYPILKEITGSPTDIFTVIATRELWIVFDNESVGGSFSSFGLAPSGQPSTEIAGLPRVSLGAGLMGTHASSLIHELAHHFDFHYRKVVYEPTFAPEGTSGGTGNPGIWASEGIPDFLTGAVARRALGLSPTGNYEGPDGPTFPDPQTGLYDSPIRSHTTGRYLQPYGWLLHGYRSTAAFFRYLADRRSELLGETPDASDRHIFRTAYGGVTGRLRVGLGNWNPEPTWIFHERPTLAESMADVETLSFEGWFHHHLATFRADGLTDNPLLQDRLVDRRNWNEALREVGTLSGRGTAGWAFDGLHGQFFYGLLYDEGVGGSYFFDAGPSPEFISVAVTRIK